MVPWARIHLPTHEAQVRFLVQEDDLAPSTSRRGTKPEHPNYQALGAWSPYAREATAVRSLRMLQPEKAQGPQQDRARPKTHT